MTAPNLRQALQSLALADLTSDAVREAAQLAASLQPRPLPSDRADGYVGTAEDLHELLSAVLPLAAPVYYETTQTGQHGTVMTLGFLARPAGPAAIEVFYAATNGRTLAGPMGPARVTATGMDPGAPDITDAEWRELRGAVGLVIRALLLDEQR